MFSLVYGLLVLFVGFDEPFADAYKTAVHQTALKEVMNGLEEKSSTFVGQTALPHTVVLACKFVVDELREVGIVTPPEEPEFPVSLPLAPPPHAQHIRL